MKKIFLFIGLFIMTSFVANEEKILKVEWRQSEWEKHFNKLNQVRKYIDESNLPHNDVKFITGTIDSLLIGLSVQLSKQIKDSVKIK